MRGSGEVEEVKEGWVMEEEEEHVVVILSFLHPSWVPPTLSDDGYELQFQVNHLGHFCLTNELVSELRVANARVISLSSVAHYAGHIDPVRLLHRCGLPESQYSRWGAYCDSKLANVLFAKHLAQRESPQIASNAVHPGKM